MGDAWTVPLTEFTRDNTAGTTILLADDGRKCTAKDIDVLLASASVC